MEKQGVTRIESIKTSEVKKDTNTLFDNLASRVKKCSCCKCRKGAKGTR